MIAALHFLARNGRLVLVAGLVIGIGLPDLALAMQPFIPEVAALMLFVTAFRIGPKEALGGMAGLRSSLAVVLLYQIGLPCLMAVAFNAMGEQGALANALVFMAAAPPISGSPNLTLMTGNDPAPALRLLIAGTALLPVTVLPAFLLWPLFGDPGTVLLSSLRLLALIGGATVLAFTLRHFLLPNPSRSTIQAIDGLAALAMAIAVIGLMAAFGPALRQDLRSVALTLAVAFAVNFGLQLGAFFVQRVTGCERLSRVAYSIAAGNRNIMLFLAALPSTLTAPILLFVACYQVPMYLTPLFLGRFYRRTGD